MLNRLGQLGWSRVSVCVIFHLFSLSNICLEACGSCVHCSWLIQWGIHLSVEIMFSQLDTGEVCGWKMGKENAVSPAKKKQIEVLYGVTLTFNRWL